MVSQLMVFCHYRVLFIDVLQLFEVSDICIEQLIFRAYCEVFRMTRLSENMNKCKQIYIIYIYITYRFTTAYCRDEKYSISSTRSADGKCMGMSETPASYACVCLPPIYRFRKDGANINKNNDHKSNFSAPS